jgi:GNAT superfamily N-acetyltransferase
VQNKLLLCFTGVLIMTELFINSDRNSDKHSDKHSYKHIKAGDVDVTIRPITSDDIEIEAAFMRDLSAQAKHENFLSSNRELSSSMISTLCNIDYINSMAYIATIQQGANEKQIGIGLYAIDSKPDEREMAVTVSDEFQHQGIAKQLANHLIKHARINSIKRLILIELCSNYKMRELAESLGMASIIDPKNSSQVIFSMTL